MGKYVLKRIGYMLLVMVILSFLMFLIYNLTPSNRAYTEAKNTTTAQKQKAKGMTKEEKEEWFNTIYQNYRLRYGQNGNMVLRYGRWMGLWPKYVYDETVGDDVPWEIKLDENGKKEFEFDGILEGNFGWSWEQKMPVVDAVIQPMKNTIFYNIFATFLALVITIPLGIVCAVKKGSKGDQAMQVITIIGYSLPTFIICILFIWVFCSLLGWLPPSGMKTPGSNYTGWKWFTDRMKYLTLPLTAMTFCSLGSMTRYVRASMIDALSMDCIRTARAKGVKEKVVIFSHAWRNALIPIVTLIVGWFLGIFGGSLVFENMFGINGMGKLMIQSLTTSDYDVVILLQLFYVAISLVGNLIIDIVYGLVDPRVRVSE